MSLDKTADGGYIVVGLKGTWSDVWLIKTDGGGLLQWDRVFDHGAYMGQPRSVTQTSDGGYLIAAAPWVLKTDAIGEKDWEFVTALPDLISTAQQTTDGGIIVFGDRAEGDYGSCTPRLNKLDIEGNELWEKLVPAWEMAPADGLQTADGGFLVAGVFNNGSGFFATRLVKLGPETTPEPPVGGIVELQLDPTDLSAHESDSAAPAHFALAGLAAAALVALGAGGWYARRRRPG